MMSPMVNISGHGSDPFLSEFPGWYGRLPDLSAMMASCFPFEVGKGESCSELLLAWELYEQGLNFSTHKLSEQP